MKFTSKDVAAVSSAMQKAITESRGNEQFQATVAAALGSTVKTLTALVTAEFERRDERMRSLASRLARLEREKQQ